MPNSVPLSHPIWPQVFQSHKATLPKRCHTVTQSRDSPPPLGPSVALNVDLENSVTLSNHDMRTGISEKKTTGALAKIP